MKKVSSAPRKPRLSVRSRNILYILGILKSSERKETLVRANVTSKELASLVKRKLIEESDKGFIITAIGRTARSINPRSDQW